MATKKKLIFQSLDNLSKENFLSFCAALVDREGDRRVSQSKVEDRSRLEVTNVLVSTFTEAGAPAVVSELLGDIGCGDQASKLDIRIAQLTSNASGGQGAGQLGVVNVTRCSNSMVPPSAVSGTHFVDKHRIQLIQRVTNIDSILDGLLERGVLQYGVYDTIRLTSGTQQQMRKIYDLALKSGDDVKNIFVELLHQQESYLVKDLLKDS
ncbi:apoptosis-associated speck-like protein containing a CARD [Stigmatopora nigra]